MCVSVFTSCTWGLEHSALSFLCLRSTGLRGHKGRGAVQAGDPLEGLSDSGLRAFLETARFVLLHTGTPLAPLTQLTLHSGLTWSETPWKRKPNVVRRFFHSSKHLMFWFFFLSASLCITNLAAFLGSSTDIVLNIMLSLSHDQTC